MGTTYDEVLESLQKQFEALTGMEADRASDIGIRLKLLAGQLTGAEKRADYILKQVFPQTAIGNYLDMHAQVRGLERKQPLHASGSLTFSRSAAAENDITIPESTVCTTGTTEDIRFATTQAGVLAAGELSVNIPARAVKGGTAGNAAAGAVHIMVTPPQGMETVMNPEPFRGGDDAEDDDALRQRLLDSYRNISNGTNKAYYKNIVLGYEDVKKAEILPRVRGRGSVDVVVVPRPGVEFDELSARVEEEIAEKREIGVDVFVRQAAEIAVNIAVNISLAPNYTEQEVFIRMQDEVNAFSDRLAIGEQVTLAALGNVLYRVEGVDNYSFISPIQDVLIGRDEVGVVSLTEINVPV